MQRRQFVTTVSAGAIGASMLRFPQSARSATKYATVRIEDVPHVRQKSDFCGEACVAMYLRTKSIRATQDDVFNTSGLSPTLGRGCYTAELVAAVRRLGVQPGQVWYRVPPQEESTDLDAAFAAMHRDLRAGIPSIVCMHYNDKPKTTEHFRLVVGYDAKTEEVLFNEPAEANGAYRRMKLAMFLKLWPLKYSDSRWTIIRLRLSGSRLLRPQATKGRGNADYAQHVMQLHEKLPNDEFQLVLERPFVVVGDESLRQVQRRATGTIRWAVDRLKRDYFSRDPNHILDIWLFKNKESYDENVKKVFADEPHTPFGYYSPSERSLIMNISTGGGTLVHEIVHPFIESNFPRCPSWFNEGLASLYEQCGDRNGHIHGYTNWRLRGLQRAIAGAEDEDGDGDGLPTFEELCGTTTREFYDDPRGTNYAQARYLCYYLQQHGLLVNYYHRFRRAAHTDPGGYKTLVTILGKPDMTKFQETWQTYVSKLTFS